jgi:hypothetical protein
MLTTLSLLHGRVVSSIRTKNHISDGVYLEGLGCLQGVSASQGLGWTALF